jgi:hypothetical protein
MPLGPAGRCERARRRSLKETERAMMRRRPVTMRRGPGVLGTVARTAVIAGTATAVSRGVSGAMDSKAQAAQQQQAANQAALDTQAQLAALQAPQVAQAQPAPAPAPAAAAGTGTDLIGQLQQLAQLKEAGVLTDAELQAAKAKLLNPAG